MRATVTMLLYHQHSNKDCKREMEENNGPQDKKTKSKENQGETGRANTYILTFSLLPFSCLMRQNHCIKDFQANDVE